MILADLHVHSKYSDGHCSIAELVDFYGSRGFGCIAITDHICETNTLMGIAARYLKYTLSAKTFPAYLAEIRREAARAWERYKMVVLPGFELSKNSFVHHRNAHILGIGVTEYVSADGDVVDLARAIRAQGALTVAAHPVPTGRAELQTLHLWDRREELKGEFDAWEVASGPVLFDAVMQSGLPMIATSDLHHPRQINSWKTLLDCEKTPDAILDAVREQRVEFYLYGEANPAFGLRPHAAI